MPTTGKFNGTAIGIYHGSNLIGSARSKSLSVNNSLIDTTTSDSSGWEENLAGLKGWTMNIEGLFTLDDTVNGEEIFADLVAGTAVTFKFSSEVSGDTYWTGTGRFESLELGAEYEGNVTFSASIKGSGSLTTATVV